MSVAAGRDLPIEPLGETALLLRFGAGLDPAVNARVHAAAAALRAAHLPGLVDIAPAYATLALHYDPAAWLDANGGGPWRTFEAAVRAVLHSPPVETTSDARVVEIPVCYGGEHGPDLDALADHAGLAASEVVARHAASRYTVAMLGFAPGFPYLFGLDAALQMPRRASPRTRVPAGSVAIGGAQTGIYPSQLPGGWQIIGRTPLTLFDATRDPPSLVMPGDRVRLVAIEAADFAERTRRA
jgi:KipI family sensor histidine kinase inhibitor